MNTTRAEENYLKAIYRLTKTKKQVILPNLIAEKVQVNPASVVDMIKKLVRKELISYSRKEGAKLTDTGQRIALNIVRSHRLWEVFLVEKLEYSWSEIHVIAEQLEHIKHPDLVDKLDSFLDFPSFDPHGDPIPDKMGAYPISKKIFLSTLSIGAECKVISVSDDNTDFLNYLEKLGISIGTKIKILEKNAFDDSLSLQIEKKNIITVSRKFADSLYVI
ncbi:MAG: iron-dependent repressor [Lutibacter sp.]|nr:MAG: iron-dependent repressor [Lutibacter sp.]